MMDVLRKIAKESGRYHCEAFRFLFEALEHSVAALGREAAEGEERHISGQELLLGLRQQAARSFGPMAAQVWRSWGVQESLDWGRIVFLLVEGGLLRRRPEDCIEDFSDGFDFDEAFVKDYELALPAEIGPIA